MKVLNDWALINLHDSARAARLKSGDHHHEAVEMVAGELIANRAFFGTFERLTNYCTEHKLTLHCEFGVCPGPTPSLGWTVWLPDDEPTSGPVLGDVLRELASRLGQLPPTAMTVRVQ